MRLRSLHFTVIRFGLGVGLLSLSVTPALAQLGVGIGFGSGYFGPGFGAFYGRAGGQGFAGFGATISPRPVYQQPRFPTAAQQEIPRQGQVTGTVNACPPQSNDERCSLPTELLRQIVISAVPQSDNQQWISTQPNVQGFYQLKLQPGQYTLSVQMPFGSTQPSEREVIIIRPGDTIKKNLHL